MRKFSVQFFWLRQWQLEVHSWFNLLIEAPECSQTLVLCACFSMVNLRTMPFIRECSYPVEPAVFSSPFLPTVVGVPGALPEAGPLLNGLDERGDLKLLFLPTYQLGGALLRQECACALVPPSVVLEDATISIIPGAGLVAVEGSRAAWLMTDLPLESIRRIRVEPSAQALAVYVQVLFAERGLSASALCAPDVSGTETDATLIWDGTAAKKAGFNVEALWRECTDTPLVLAVWACRDSGAIRLLRQVLGEAARRGEAEAGSTTLSYRILSAESESIRTLHCLARKHAIAGASVESIGFC